MLAERGFIFGCFGVGLVSTLMALMSAAWILMTLEVASVATLGIGWCIYVIIRQAARIHGKFHLRAGESVSFDDILNSGVVPGGGIDDDELDENAVLIPRASISESNAQRGVYV